MEAVYHLLLEAGWIKEFGFHDTKEAYGFKWTEKGSERARWVNLIGDELNLGPKGLRALLTICHLHAPHE